MYVAAAQAVVLVHFAWIIFVVTGAVWLRRYPRWQLAHLLAVIYSVGIEAFRWICPLTYLEQALWRRAGEEAYREAFLTHYLEKLIYAPVPQWLLVLLMVTILAVTVGLYRRPASD
jgi:hypothetical protein